MKLKILTPLKMFYEGDIIKLITKDIKGSLGILFNHSPMISVLVPCITCFKCTDGKEYCVNVFDGILKISNNEVMILCSKCEMS